jgi:hypothetical protein
MFKIFKQKRNWKQEQADIDRLTELMFKRNAELCDEYRKLLDKYTLNGNQGN